MEKSPPLITAVRCLQFAPPEFQLEIHCLHETQQYLRKIVHEIGLELKSSAVCTQVRRVRDGVFTLENALLRTQWNLSNIQNAILKSKLKVKNEIKKSLAHQEGLWAEEEEGGKTEAGQTDGEIRQNRGGNILLKDSVIK
ncbi:hypothetical protein JD844_005008 [Phrynosoma platyrhinos]|uniref:tRNA pseudouridine synthase 2 n=1 Tax=Phrynosoma platyrhinos TaxID=52577 RepID=A0ABQ7SE14_PHRPL|nr:hypothetical protein JD844_005008 [Phrynosoma platyrhinos]